MKPCHSSLLVLSLTISLAFTERNCQALTVSALLCQRSVWWTTEASSHQRNIGKLPRLPSRCLSLPWAWRQIWRMRESARSPRTAIMLTSPLLRCSFLAKTNERKRRRYNASPTPSRLSCHWLHMRNNETSLETRLPKGRWGGFWVIFPLKEEGVIEIKKKQELCLLLSQAIVFWEVLGIWFLSLTAE